jgi:hypothetical protein
MMRLVRTANDPTRHHEHESGTKVRTLTVADGASPGRGWTALLTAEQMCWLEPKTLRSVEQHLGCDRKLHVTHSFLYTRELPIPPPPSRSTVNGPQRPR